MLTCFLIFLVALFSNECHIFFFFVETHLSFLSLPETTVTLQSLFRCRYDLIGIKIFLLFKEV